MFGIVESIQNHQGLYAKDYMKVILYIDKDLLS